MVQNFFVFMLTGVVIGLICFVDYKLIRYFIKKRKNKKNGIDDNFIDIK